MITDVKSRKKRTELLLQHGEEIPQYIGDLGFAIASTFTREEKRLFVDFLSKLTNQSLNPEKFSHDVLKDELFNFKTLEEYLNRESLSEAKKNYLWTLTEDRMSMWLKEQRFFDKLNLSQKEKVYEYLAGVKVEFAQKHNLSILFPQNIGDSIDVQVALLSKMKERLGEEAKNHLFAVHTDWVFGYPELASPEFDYFVTHRDDMLALAEFRMDFGIKMAETLLESLDKKGVTVEAVVCGTDICIDKGTYKPPWIMNQFVYSFLKSGVEALRRLGIKYIIKHTDGNMLARDSKDKTVLERLIECDIDAFQAVDPYCMDIKRVKKVIMDQKTGLPKICLIGGIDTIGMLPIYDGSILSSEDDFAGHVLYCLREGGIQGGYLPDATNDVSPPRGGEKARKRYEILSKIKKDKAKYSLDSGGIAKIKV